MIEIAGALAGSTQTLDSKGGFQNYKIGGQVTCEDPSNWERPNCILVPVSGAGGAIHLIKMWGDAFIPASGWGVGGVIAHKVGDIRVDVEILVAREKGTQQIEGIQLDAYGAACDGLADAFQSAYGTPGKALGPGAMATPYPQTGWCINCAYTWLGRSTVLMYTLRSTQSGTTVSRSSCIALFMSRATWDSEMKGESDEASERANSL